MDYLVPLLTVVVVLGGSLAIRALRQRAGHRVPVIPWKQMIAYFVVTAVAVAAANLADGRGEPWALHDLLLALPLLLYIAFAVHWLIRNRREIAAGWKAETAWDRERGLIRRKR